MLAGTVGNHANNFCIYPVCQGLYHSEILSHLKSLENDDRKPSMRQENPGDGLSFNPFSNITSCQREFSEKSRSARSSPLPHHSELPEKTELLHFFSDLFPQSNSKEFPVENMGLSLWEDGSEISVDVQNGRRKVRAQEIFDAESYQKSLNVTLSATAASARHSRSTHLDEITSLSRAIANLNCSAPGHNKDADNRKINKKGYIFLPVIGDDAIEHILMHTSKQIMNGKEPYTIILERKSDRVLFERNKLLYKSNNPILFAEKPFSASNIKSPRSRKQISNQNRVAGIKIAYEKMTVITCEEDNALALLNPISTKLYISSHGEAGDSHFYFKFSKGFREMYSLTMAKKLLQAGLPGNYQDIRLTACHSASSLEAEDFTDDTLNSMDTRMHNTSLAQQFSADMYNTGYIESIISGYHGEGKPLPAVNKYGKSYSVREAENGDRIRRSELKKRFLR